MPIRYNLALFLYRGAVEHLALGESIFTDHAGGNRNMLLLSLGIGKAEIDEFYAVLVNLAQHIRRRHDLFLQNRGSKTGQIVPINASMPTYRAKILVWESILTNLHQLSAISGDVVDIHLADIVEAGSGILQFVDVRGVFGRTHRYR